jgi:hypothetical protein
MNDGSKRAKVSAAVDGLGETEGGGLVRNMQLAHALLKAGLPAARVRRLMRSKVAERLLKYSADQPRVPAGSGRTSGQWTSGAAGQAAGPAHVDRRPRPKHIVAARPKAPPPHSTVTAARPKATLGHRPDTSNLRAAMAGVGVLGPTNPGVNIGGLSEPALGGLATFIRGLAISPEAMASAAFGGLTLAMIPTNGPLGGWIKLPGPGNVSVFRHLDEPGLTFRWTVDGVQHEWMAAPAAGGVYLGPDGKAIARWTRIASGLALLVSTAALLNDDRPKLCPATVPDRRGTIGLAYEYFMKRLINPLNPTPTEMAYGFHGPTGNLVRIDDCQQQTGMLFEYKGPGYADHFAKKDFIWDKCYDDMVGQAERQLEATDGKQLTWIFAERTVFLFMKERFAKLLPQYSRKIFPNARARSGTAPMSYLATNGYVTRSRWNSDGLSPPEMAGRLLQFVEHTAHLVPPDQRWFIMDRKRLRHAPLADDLTKIIRGNERRGDFGETKTGDFSVTLFTLDTERGPPSNRSLRVSLSVGPTHFGSMEFEIGDIANPPDYSQLGYPTYRDMIGAVAEVWPCPWILATNYRKRPPPVDASVNGPAAPPFGGAWIVYLSAPLAKDLTLPAELVAEPTAGGGLFLSATQTLLDQSSADDMRRSRLLEAIARERIGEDPGRLPAKKPARVGPA